MSLAFGPATQPQFWSAATGVAISAITGLATVTGSSRTLDSVPTILENYEHVSYLTDVVTADAEGAFTLWASNNYDPRRPSLAKWVDVTSECVTSPAAVAGANLVSKVAMRQCPYQAVRLRYVHTSGTATLKTFLAFKG